MNTCPDCSTKFHLKTPISPAAMHTDRTTVIVYHHQESVCPGCGARYTTALLEIPQIRCGHIKCVEPAEGRIIEVPGLIHKA